MGGSLLEQESSSLYYISTFTLYYSAEGVVRLWKTVLGFASISFILSSFYTKQLPVKLSRRRTCTLLKHPSLRCWATITTQRGIQLEPFRKLRTLVITHNSYSLIASRLGSLFMGHYTAPQKQYSIMSVRTGWNTWNFHQTYNARHKCHLLSLDQYTSSSFYKRCCPRPKVLFQAFIIFVWLVSNKQ